MSFAETQLSNDQSQSQEWWHSLPFNLESVEVSKGHRPAGYRYFPEIINLKARFKGTEILTCGEAESVELAMTKAVAELLERAAMKTWSEQNPSAGARSSNGWAAHSTSEQSKMAAVFEVAERDAVLAQWYTSTPFIKIDSNTLPEKISSWVNDELSQSEYSDLILLLSTQGLGPSLTCLFVKDGNFGISSHSAKPDLFESVESAIGECCRSAHLSLRKAFWDDCQKLMMGTKYSKVEPGAHAVYYAYIEPFPGWMFAGKSVSWDQALDLWNKRVELFIENVLHDSKFTEVMNEPLSVGFAKHPNQFELSWGPADQIAIVNSGKASNRFADSMTYSQINFKPHIIS